MVIRVVGWADGRVTAAAMDVETPVVRVVATRVVTLAAAVRVAAARAVAKMKLVEAVREAATLAVGAHVAVMLVARAVLAVPQLPTQCR